MIKQRLVQEKLWDNHETSNQIVIYELCLNLEPFFQHPVQSSRMEMD